MILITLVMENDFHSDCISLKGPRQKSRLFTKLYSDTRFSSLHFAVLSEFRALRARSRSKLFVIVSKTVGTSHTCLISEMRTHKAE